MLFLILLTLAKKPNKSKDDAESSATVTERAIPVANQIQSLNFRRNSRGDLFADLLFFSPVNTSQILLMRSETRNEESFMSAGNLRDNARFRNGGTEVTIKFFKMPKDVLKKYFFCLHFYYPNRKYFSTEIFTYNSSTGVFEINRGGTNYMLIFGLVTAVIVVLIVGIVVYMRLRSGGDRIKEPEEEL